jgi:hypothetical protein
MKISKFVILQIILFAIAGTIFSQEGDALFKVVLVKGKPLKSGKLALKDGQKMIEKDKVMFTTQNDVVILMNSHFQKIYLKPRNRTELNKLQRVTDYIEPKNVLADLSRGGITRDEETQILFQSVFDTLRINTVKAFKQSGVATQPGYTLLNQYMEVIPKTVWQEGIVLYVRPPKAGLYYLHYSSGQSQNKVMAEIEFLEKDEVLAELKFVDRSTAIPDSSKSNQLKYLRKMYPKISVDEANAIVIRSEVKER